MAGAPRYTMPLYSTTLRIHSEKPLPVPSAQRKNGTLLRLIANWAIQTLAGGAKSEGYDAYVNTEAGAKASQTLTFASSSGTVGLVVNGVTITVAWASSDIASMTALVAAVNASSNALVQYLVEMSNTRAQVALTSFPVGNKVLVGQFEFTAVSGTPTDYGQFNVSGNDTADAASLAAAINNHPRVSKYWQAVSTTSTVSLFRFAAAGTPTGGVRLATNSSAAALTQEAAVAVGLVRSFERTRLANGVTTAATGTNVTAGGARLTGGAGSNVTQREELP